MVGEDVATDGCSTGPAGRMQPAASRVVALTTWSPGRCLAGPGAARRASGLAADQPRRGHWQGDVGPWCVRAGECVAEQGAWRWFVLVGAGLVSPAFGADWLICS